MRDRTSVPRTYVDATRLWADSRPRAFVQRRGAAILRRLGGAVPGGTVLDLGSGRQGTGLRLALEVFGAARAEGPPWSPSGGSPASSWAARCPRS